MFQTIKDQFVKMGAVDSAVGSATSEPTERPAETRVVGKIIKVSEDGWGFISSKDIKFTRIFFHWTSLRQDTLKFTELKTGMKVEFTPFETEGKGTRAIKIKVLKDEPTAQPVAVTTVAETK